MQNGIAQRSILFIRHAESEYNYAQKVALQSEEEVRLEQESLEVKFDPALMDCPLTQKGVQQCLDAVPDLQNIPVSVVIVSPLLRALETAYLLFKDHPSKPRFVIEPLLSVREMQLSSCDVGGLIESSVTRFQEFDFSRLLNNPLVKEAPSMWSLEYNYNDELKEQAREYIKQNLQPDQTYAQHGPALYVQFMRTIYPKSVETFNDTKNRIQDAKEFLKQYNLTVPEGTKLAVVCHSRTLHTMSSNQYDAEGHPIEGQWWHNCQAKELII